jgi:hypothetical protein
VAADLIAQEWSGRRRNPREWLRHIGELRSERMRFAMQFSLEVRILC